MALSTTNAQRKSAPYIPSWPLLPPEEPCIRFCHLMCSITKSNIESIELESKRVMTLWNELNEEERQVYYKEYEDDLETYWRLQMVICGCQSCKQAISKFQGSIDVSHFISKLNHKQQRNLFQNEKTIKDNTVQNEGDPPPNQTLLISNKDKNDCNESVCQEQTDDNSIPIDDSADSCAALDKVIFMETTPKATAEMQSKNSYNQTVSNDTLDTLSVNVYPSIERKCSNDCEELSAEKSEDNGNRIKRRGYPFTTSNCMDLSGDESDESDEFRSIPMTLLSPDRCHSPNLAFQDSHDISDAPVTLSKASSTSSAYLNDYNIPPDGSKEVVSSEDAPFPNQVDSSKDVKACSPDATSPVVKATCCPLISNSETNRYSPNRILKHSQPSPQNQQIDLQNKFNEIKRICIDMILEKLKYLKSIENDLEKQSIYDINEVHGETNNLDSCLPEFAPIMNTLRRDTWQLHIENESRKVYNRKVTLKLKWTSKGGEPIQCLDSNGLRLDFRRMQPFVKLKPLKSLKTPILLNIHGNGIYSRLDRQIVSFKPKRRLKTSLKAYQMRSKENFRLRLQNKKDKVQVSDGPVVCEVCNAGFTEQQSLLVHRASCNNVHVMKAKFMEPIFGGLTLACPLDGMDSPDNIVKHCTICSVSFTDLILHEVHMYIAHKSSIWWCNICEFKFQNNNLYLEHMVDHQKLQCVICKNLFQTTEHLNQHLKFKHQEFKKYCKKCDRVLPTIHLYQSHMVEHLTIRPFSCSLCCKRFKRKNNLVGHLWTHKPHAYKCVGCQLSFPRPHLLKAHNRRVHSGIF